ncbi:MAG: hypothetical protein EOO48_06595 [Flavobacterium sp.]|nr:MAG: hypothetical protein EOO48_06595 [Flavobacterium sp.]
MKVYSLVIISFLCGIASAQNRVPEKKFTNYIMMQRDSSGPDRYKEKAVTNADSIKRFAEEFESLNKTLRKPAPNAVVDSLANYKLKYVSVETSTTHVPTPIRSGGKILKINDAEKDKTVRFKNLNFVSLCSDEWLVVFTFPKVEIGNTYERSERSTYYYQKTTQ